MEEQIKVIVRKGSGNACFTVPDSTPVIKVLNDAHIDISLGKILLNGITLLKDEVYKTFKDFGVGEKTKECSLVHVWKYGENGDGPMIKKVFPVFIEPTDCETRNRLTLISGGSIIEVASKIIRKIQNANPDLVCMEFDEGNKVVIKIKNNGDSDLKLQPIAVIYNVIESSDEDVDHDIGRALYWHNLGF